ncbi:MAG: isoleucine--tRNA ligase, partial [Lentisphaeria bacterium]|nr:isoleucine--tRNA ligase [Lentisphaeria bacterium]
IQREQKPGMTVATENGITIALDTNLNEALLAEGFARELVSKIQNLRKESDFDVADHIKVQIKDGAYTKCIDTFKDYISNEILADTITYCAELADGTALDVNGENVEVKIEKI